jgi:hypothetical protein
MADIIAFADLRNSAKQNEILSLFEGKPVARRRSRKAHKPEAFPTCRPGISGNLNDLYEQANAVLMRHYDGDTKVPPIVAEKCFELLKALSEYAEPE